MNTKSKIRTLNKSKIVTYDADLSMDSLNSTIIPLRTDKNGRIIIEENKCEHNDKILLNAHINDVENIKESQNENSNIWCGQEILSKLSTLKNVCTLCYKCFNIILLYITLIIILLYYLKYVYFLGPFNEANGMEFREMFNLSRCIRNLLTRTKCRVFVHIFIFFCFIFVESEIVQYFIK